MMSVSETKVIYHELTVLTAPALFHLAGQLYIVAEK